MNELQEYLQREGDREENNRYKYQEREYKRVMRAIEDVEKAKELEKRKQFKDKLKELGVKIVEKDKNDK